ncbi:MAG: hypothetical protein ACYDHC_05880 [Desulfuromonadaceae bacterium]
MDAKEKEGIEALKRLLDAVQSHDFGTHSVKPIYELLAGLYSDDFAPSMWALCTRIGDEHFQDILSTMQLIRSTRKEPHEFFKEGSRIWVQDVIKGLRPHRCSYLSREFDDERERRQRELENEDD